MKKKEIKNKTKDVVFLLDRSGSMYNMVDDTIGGYNSYLEKFRNEDARITTILFNDDIEVIGERIEVNKCKKLDNKVYHPRGSTALLDAIGNTITMLDKNKTDELLFIITTDGYENASREYTRNTIKKMIEKHKKWEFIYLGADIDSFGEASTLGIRKDRTANYEKSKEGVKTMFGALNKISEMLFDDDIDIKNCQDSWKVDLEEYFDDNNN